MATCLGASVASGGRTTYLPHGWASRDGKFLSGSRTQSLELPGHDLILDISGWNYIFNPEAAWQGFRDDHAEQRAVCPVVRFKCIVVCPMQHGLGRRTFVNEQTTTGRVTRGIRQYSFDSLLTGSKIGKCGITKHQNGKSVKHSIFNPTLSPEESWSIRPKFS